MYEPYIIYRLVSQAKKDLVAFIDFNQVITDIQKEIIEIYRMDTKDHGVSIPQYIQRLTKNSPLEKNKTAREFKSLSAD